MLLKKIDLVIVFVLCLSLSGCATVINGTTQKVPVTSTPNGAVATTEEGLHCTTPCSLELARKSGHVITIKKEGFEDYIVNCKRVLSAVVLGNILVGGLIGATADAASGSMYRMDPDSINAELKPLAVAVALPLEGLKDLQARKDAVQISNDEYNKQKGELMNGLKAKDGRTDTSAAEKGK